MPFTARYTGNTCPVCEKQIFPGDTIDYDEHNELRHVSCTPARPDQICPRCFQVIPLSGVCGVCDE